MPLKSVGSTDNYLRVSDLRENEKFENKLAYVANAKAGTSKMNKGFFTFYVKDVNGNLLPAQVFNPADFIESGVSANGLRKRLVLISGYAQIYNNAWSIIVNSIRTCSADDAADLGITLDFAKFRGTVDTGDCSAFFEVYQKACQQSFPALFTTACLDEFCDGRSGGFLLALNETFKALSAYKNMPSVSYEDLIQALSLASNVLYVYYAYTDSHSICSNAAAIKILSQLTDTYKDHPAIDIAIDAASAIIGFATPQHICAVIIKREFESKVALFNACYRNSALPKNMVTSYQDSTLGGVQLLRSF